MNLIILTSGLENDLVAKKIGDAVTKEQRYTTENDEQLAARSRIKCVGITSWGALKGNEKPVFKTRVWIITIKILNFQTPKILLFYYSKIIINGNMPMEYTAIYIGSKMVIFR